VKAVDPHGDGPEPFFDVVPLCVVELTAQLSASKGSQIAASIDEKLRIGNIMSLGKAVQECRPQKSEISDVRTRATLSLTSRGQSRGGCRHRLQAAILTLCRSQRRATVSPRQLGFASRQPRPATAPPSSEREAF